MKRISIIGGGASGTLLAVNLIKQSGETPLEINLIEKSKKVGLGVAYATSSDVHLLNVPAGKMGAFPDDIEHFHKWLAQKGFDYTPTDFVPRKIYGEYLREILAETIQSRLNNVVVNLIDSEAIDVLTESESALVLLDSGEAIPSTKVVLAFGNFLPSNLQTPSNDYKSSDKYFQNSWDNAIFERISQTDDVLLIGTGLTAVDNILSFYNRGHQGKITAISTHGWFPAVHQPAPPYQSLKDEISEQRSVRGILNTVRRHCKDNENWRSVIDSLRPFTQEMWYKLPTNEKQRFMRHLRRAWDISRHRMPPKCFDILQEMQSVGRLEVIRGKITDINLNNGRFSVEYRHKGQQNAVFADSVVNCIGSESNFAKLPVPLVQSLLAAGHIKPDALSLGLDATPDGKLINSANRTSRIFATLGTALKGVLWESTAMPEIRFQAKTLAAQILAETH